MILLTKRKENSYSIKKKIKKNKQVRECGIAKQRKIDLCNGNIT